MILRIEDFRNEASIPGLLPESDLASPVNEAIRQRVDDYITKYEPQFIRDFGMSAAEYGEVCRWIEENEYRSVEADNRMKAFVGRLRFSLANYVSFHLLRSQTITPIGGVVLGSENGTRSQTADTQVLLWNQMADNSRDMYRSWYGKGNPDSEVFRNINSMGI